jgi:hypothetical protein
MRCVHALHNVAPTNSKTITARGMKNGRPRITGASHIAGSFGLPSVQIDQQGKKITNIKQGKSEILRRT